jgi:hypothetical protein
VGWGTVGMETRTRFPIQTCPPSSYGPPHRQAKAAAAFQGEKLTTFLSFFPQGNSVHLLNISNSLLYVLKLNQAAFQKEKR